MPHSGTNLNNGSPSRTGQVNAISDGNVAGQFAWHASPVVAPTVGAVFLGAAYPCGKAINQIQWDVHLYHFGFYQIWGSQNSGSGAGFHNSGTWTQIAAAQAPGSNNGMADRSVWTTDFANDVAYRAYKVTIDYQAISWATYGWHLNRVSRAALAPFANLERRWMPHSWTASLLNAATRGDATAMSDGATAGAFALHSSPAAYPGTLAIFVGLAYPLGLAVNQIVFYVHGNSFGAAEIHGSNDCGTGANFHSSGTWTLIANINGGGGGSGQSEWSTRPISFTNNAAYLAYRINFLNSGGVGAGWATYGWRLNRT
jgi:hypothetical protein